VDARARAPREGGQGGRCLLGREPLHLAVGPRHAGPAGRPAEPARPRDRRGDLRGVPRPDLGRALPRPRREGGEAAAAALREHRHEGPDAVRRRLRDRPREPEHREHHARGDPAGVREGRAADAARAARRRCGPRDAGEDRRGRRRPRRAGAFVASWNSLMSSIDRKSAALAGAGA
jgi:hypothetical protein